MTHYGSQTKIQSIDRLMSLMTFVLIHICMFNRHVWEKKDALVYYRMMKLWTSTGKAVSNPTRACGKVSIESFKMTYLAAGPGEYRVNKRRNWIQRKPGGKFKIKEIWPWGLIRFETLPCFLLFRIFSATQINLQRRKRYKKL